MKDLIIKLLDGFTAKEYGVLTKNNTTLHVSLNNALKTIDDLEGAIAAVFVSKKEQDAKIETLSNQLRTLLNQGKIDVEDVKEYYENKYSGAPWKYDFEGSGRERDTKYALRVTANGEIILKEIAKEIFDRYKPNNPNEVVKSVMRYFSLRASWKYKYDKDNYGKNEFWALAETSAASRVGDCDDLAIFMHNIIFYILEMAGMSEQYWRLKLCAGSLLGEGGHCFNVWLADDGEWYTVESTYDLKGSLSKTWLKTPIRNNNMYRSFWGFARKDRSWKSSNMVLKPYKLGE